MPDLYLSATADAAGVAQIRITPRGSARWIITQVSPSMDDAPGETVGLISKNGFPVAPFVPQSDAVAGEPPIELQPGDEMTIRWTNATPGGAGRAWVAYDQVDL